MWKTNRKREEEKDTMLSAAVVKHNRFHLLSEPKYNKKKKTERISRFRSEPPQQTSVGT